MTRPIRIANISGFYGDRLAAAREMIDGPDPVDVLTGDYLAELTMFILWKARRKNPDAGYATTFLRQMEQVLGDCLDRGVKVVANAGGLNPHGLGSKLQALAVTLGLDLKIAIVDGDDILADLPRLQEAGEALAHLDTQISLADATITPVTANAYLGGFGIAAGLAGGADIVITPRVTDAALVVGPAAWWHAWAPTAHDEIAGAIVAGHIVECGPQATGGNYSFAAQELVDDRYPGFPIAEIAADGSSVITKQPGSGGAVTVGTVTAQLLYEIDEPRYRNPDAIARFDSVRLRQIGPDRVSVTDVRGLPPSGFLKVAINYSGGWRNTMSMVVAGLDLDGKVRRATSMLGELLGGWSTFADHDIRLVGEELRITVKDEDPSKVGRQFSNAVMELLLASYAGAYATTPPSEASEYGVYWPTLVPSAVVEHSVTLPDGSRLVI
ncbi:MAG TPA: acyclic terpene utilization AtuA family protein, partial [Mycobacteriales bacterium]|nr:acyclic terpene utilization AtuA family protein [Mycobacteriales bacterium]